MFASGCAVEFFLPVNRKVLRKLVLDVGDADFCECEIAAQAPLSRGRAAILRRLKPSDGFPQTGLRCKTKFSWLKRFFLDNFELVSFRLSPLF